MRNCKQHGILTLVVVGLTLICGLGHAQGGQGGVSPARITLEDLAKMNKSRLKALYEGGTAHEIPLGEGYGIGLLTPGVPVLNWATRLGWQGKVFMQDEATGRVYLVNGIFGITSIADHATDAEVYFAPSIFDGRPTIRLDYRNSNALAARGVTDEIRQIAPHLFLGRVVHDAFEEGKFVDLGFFALDFARGK